MHRLLSQIKKYKMTLLAHLDHLLAQNNHQLLKPHNVWYQVCIQEALASCGSFAPQGGLIARQNLAICVRRNTCIAISTNLPSGWFYQDHRWSLINESVVIIKPIFGPSKKWSQLCDLVYIIL